MRIQPRSLFNLGFDGKNLYSSCVTVISDFMNVRWTAFCAHENPWPRPSSIQLEQELCHFIEDVQTAFLSGMEANGEKEDCVFSYPERVMNYTLFIILSLRLVKVLFFLSGMGFAEEKILTISIGGLCGSKISRTMLMRMFLKCAMKVPSRI